ncbi:MAG: NHL repeat-containing protein [Candidatus Marinimicrobia bacterium]|nr:NHL repeat-containing protein [Candidatus Neomarinimicrobiota bacterium]MCF7880217.1 NHL repeat-containing protein [Candidatus Neomarinimicrobiota bacterium]
MEKNKGNNVPNFHRNQSGKSYILLWLFLVCLYSVIPYAVFASSPILVETIIPRGDEETGEINPGAIAVTTDGVIYLTDPGRNRILKLAPDGRVLDTRGRFGWQPEEYDVPADIALAQNLNLYVADYNNSRLQMYDRNMNFIRTVPLENADEGVVYYPLSVDQAPGGWLYVLDTEQNQILQLNPQGNLLQSLGTFTELGRFMQNASKMQVSPKGNLWVLAERTGKILIFDRFGTLKRTVRDSSITSPVGVAFAPKSNYVLNRTRVLTRISSKDFFPEKTLALQLEESQNATDITAARGVLYILATNPPEIYVYRIDASRGE